MLTIVPLPGSRKSNMEFHKVLFLIHYFPCINDLPKVTAKKAKCTLYADNTSIILTNCSCKGFEINMNKIFFDTHEWFKANLLLLNFKKFITYNLGQKKVMILIPCT
jgi:hypothetical protein